MTLSPPPCLPPVPPPAGARARAVGAPGRMAALRRSGLMVPAPDATFDRTCALVTRLLGAPTALVTLVEPGRQIYRGAVGVPPALAASRETRLDELPCQRVVAKGRPLAIDTARPDADFEGQAYLGVPLRSTDGEILGALCAIGPLPREWTDDDLVTLIELAALLTDSVAYREATARLSDEARARADAQALTDAAINALDDVFVVVGLDGRLRRWNGALAAATGLDADALDGLPVDALVLPADAGRVRDAVRAALDGASATVSAALFTGDGGGALHELTCSRVCDSTGAVVGVCATGRDVSGREAAGRALRESELRFRSFVEATTQVVWMADAEGAVTELSAAWASFTGQTPAEIDGWGWANAVHPDDIARVAEAWAMAIAARSHHEIEYRVRSRHGGYHRFAIRAVPVFDGPAFLGWVGTCTDVEDARLAAEAALAHQAALLAAMADAERGRAEAEQAAQMKSALLANLSHEIRTPLTSIIGFADILAEEAAEHDADSEDGTFAQLIGRGGRRLLHTLSSVLDLAQMEAGRHEVVLVPLDARAVVAETAALLGPQAEAKGLRLTIDLPDQPAPVLADEAALGRILTNLVGNAVKFTDAGAVSLTLGAGPGGVEIVVADTGRGISPDFVPQLFDEFRQESEGHGRRYEGNGLGLAITRRLVEMLEGTVAVESVLGEGSRFTVRLPPAL